MSDDDVLRDRFRSHQPDQTDDADDSSGAHDTDETGETDMADVTHETQETDSSDETSVRERKQEAMYLRPEQRERLRDFYDELDGRSKVAGEGGLAKNDDFYEAFVAFVIDERREEFIEYLELDEL
ncbi:hypothetical protein [Haloarcula sp. JP-L23]|uniref:hypothetical protein n=1 Tax=Haloarcula sp. JP-L23 TaxID=2716717 RepID=UPI00140F434D|nr:hypothetical protein G9465_24945 [Haloarcula sp. JP-L23]